MRLVGSIDILLSSVDSIYHIKFWKFRSLKNFFWIFSLLKKKRKETDAKDRPQKPS